MSKWTIEEQKQHRKEWTAALRSGKYVQGRGSLCAPSGTTDRWCCLGVGYDVMGVEKTLSIGFAYSFVDLDREDPANTRNYASLPGPSMTDYFGLVDIAGGGKLPFYGYISLSQLNDQGMTFDQIADIIDFEPADMFVTEKVEEPA